MKIPHRIASALGLVIAWALLGFLNMSALAQKDTAVSTATNGVRATVFDTAQGTVKVYLPDDIRAGDTISGTVVVDPKGKDATERARNEAEINELAVSFEMPPASEGRHIFDAKIAVSVGVKGFTFEVPSLDNFRTALGSVRASSPVRLGITLSKPGGSQILGSSNVSLIDLEPPLVPTPGMNALRNITIQGLSQAGKPTHISAALDGNFANTILRVGGLPVSVLVESPRGCVFESPAQPIGPVDVTLSEGGVERVGNYRNVQLRLTAPRTTLKKGETTTLTVRVDGLQGITQTVPISIVKTGVVSMEGGDSQTWQIQPSDVDAGGGVTWTLGITGQQAGAWAATATVMFNPTPQSSPTPQPSPSIQPTPGGSTTTGPGTTANQPPCDLQSQVVHIESKPNGNENAWIIEIKLPNGKVIKIRMKGKKPKLQYCDWISIKKCHTDGGEIYIDDWEKTNPPPKPPKPPKPPSEPTKPEGTKTEPPSVPDAPKPPEAPPGPTGGGDKTEPVPEPPCKEGEKKTNRRFISCELSETVVTPIGQDPTTVTIIDVVSKILELLGADKGVEIGTKLSEAFSTNKAKHIYVKFKTRFVDETWVCKNGKWVLESSVEGKSETGWIKLFDSQGGGGFNWLPGSTAGDLEAAIDAAKPEGCP